MRTVELREREYLTTGEAARLFGHGEAFWREAFDAGDVTGYRFGRRKDRHIEASSIRAYLRSIANPVADGDGADSRTQLRAEARRLVAGWARKRRAAQGS